MDSRTRRNAGSPAAEIRRIDEDLERRSLASTATEILDQRRGGEHEDDDDQEPK
jgi:hypothetical protein